MSDVGIQRTPGPTVTQQAAEARVNVDPEVRSRASRDAGSFGGIDQDTFLELLVAQMRYQNPLQPMDGQEFLNQAAQFATVERLQSVLEAQNQAVAYQRVILSNSMIGKQALGVDEFGNPVDGRVDGVHYDQGQPFLVVDGARVPLDYVETIGEGVAPTPPTDATNDPTGTASPGTTPPGTGTEAAGASGPSIGDLTIGDPAGGAVAGGELIVPAPTTPDVEQNEPDDPTGTAGASATRDSQEQTLS
ncbi:MAG: flagellar hook capping FlgD N-terminal domain-containing protein [Actinomycetota bacterium]|nr:flagellar hook capping FlgD N-terminal domain-containing protein [Actinomycetota bacterium]